MLAELEALQTQTRMAAREKFIAAAWRQRPAEELLALAADAGLSGAEGDDLLEKVSRGREQVAHVEQLPRLRKDAAGANSRFEKVQARANAEIAKLESEIQEAAYEAEVVRKAFYAAEESSRQLLGMYDEGLLPMSEVPQEVLELIKRRDAEAEFQKVDMARAEVFNERNRWRGIVRNIEERLAHVPITLTSQRDESLLQDRLKEARRQLADAETCLKKAEAASDAARKAIP